MSITYQKHSVSEFPEVTASKLDVAGKFRIYRMGAESTERKLKEAKVVIELLKEDINSSRDSEKNLRNQLSSTQNRLIHLEQTLKKFINVSEQQRQNEKISQQIHQKIEKISEVIEHTRKESQNLLKHVSKEMDLVKEIENLRTILAKKTREHDLMKMEIQALTTEKKNIETASRQKLRNLENELEKLKQARVDAESRYRDTLMYYQRELEEKDQAVKFYEKERKSFLDDFEPTKVPEIDPDDIKYGGSMISIPSSKRFPEAQSSGNDETQMKPEESNGGITSRSQCLERSNTTSSAKGEDQSFSKGCCRRKKPQLEFLMPSQSTNSVKSGQKRRLFSTNSNYYAD